MSEDTGGEKRFDPTPKRKSDAAKKGDVLRSKEVATFAVMASGTAMLLVIGPWLLSGLKRVAQAALAFDPGALGHFTPATLITLAASELLPPIFALGLTVALVTVGSQMLLGEGRWVPSNLSPKGSRINPAKGIKKIVGTQGLIELGKSILKLALLGAIAAYWVAGNLPLLLGLGRGSLDAQLAFAWDALTTLVALVASFSSPEGLFWAKLSAVSTLACAPIVVFGWLCQKQLVQGLTFGAVK